MLKIILSVFIFLCWSEIQAASCCGSASSFPAMITGDERYRLSLALSYGEFVGDVDAHGKAIFRNPSERDSFQTVELNGAALLSDRWQAGLSFPVSRKERKTQRLKVSD